MDIDRRTAYSVQRRRDEQDGVPHDGTKYVVSHANGRSKILIQSIDISEYSSEMISINAVGDCQGK